LKPKTIQNLDVNQGDWKTYCLGDVTNIITGKLNSNASAEYGKYPFFTCSKEDYKINSYSFDCEAILLAGNNAVGDFGIKHYNGKFDAYQRTYVITIKHENEFDYDFLYYALKLRLKEFQRYSFGTATQYLTKTILDPFEFEAPSYPKQKIIGGILGSLDRLIEKLTNQNQILEKIIQTIFKSWFIDFDNQTEFVDSEIGEIPKGWTTSTLSKHTKFVTGGTWGKESSDEKYSSLGLFLRGMDLPKVSNGNDKTVKLLYGKPNSQKDRKLISGDIVIEISGGSSTQLTGRSLLITDDLLERFQFQLFPGSFCKLLRFQNIDYSKFIYLLLQWIYDNGIIYHYETGTTAIKNFQYRIFSEDYKFVLPPKKNIDDFNNIITPTFIQKNKILKEKQILEKIRDSLLPKLLSGEIRV